MQRKVFICLQEILDIHKHTALTWRGLTRWLHSAEEGSQMMRVASQAAKPLRAPTGYAMPVYSGFQAPSQQSPTEVDHIMTFFKGTGFSLQHVLVDCKGPSEAGTALIDTSAQITKTK